MVDLVDMVDMVDLVDMVAMDPTAIRAPDTRARAAYANTYG